MQLLHMHTDGQEFRNQDRPTTMTSWWFCFSKSHFLTLALGHTEVVISCCCLSIVHTGRFDFSAVVWRSRKSERPCAGAGIMLSKNIHLLDVPST